MTLLVHCLQASSKPEPCWALLAATSRMAISLGFHQKSQKVDAYSTIEFEEGKRAWWLCHIMEKTFCTIFDYPSVSSPSDVFNADIPRPFTPTSSMSLSDNTIFGTNETSAVAFFDSMIQLTQLRDSLLSPQITQTPDQKPLNHLLPLFNNNNNDNNPSFSPLLHLHPRPQQRPPSALPPQQPPHISDPLSHNIRPHFPAHHSRLPHQGHNHVSLDVALLRLHCRGSRILTLYLAPYHHHRSRG
ncbi:hypothetical protein GJ744_002843 [Endocarpon pusillum]|uniref:Xylanolytic transcriptional activator regulatory domain-containing protein n=1 Tax=Endocarpon pusillum TaxID=364733 RepID=A0A8H7A7P1_9EURO|nr:hypothetical protein GJ744_002843 [Endocarpon pusillum]